MIGCNQEQREFLKVFFENTMPFITSKDMLDPNNIKIFIGLYSRTLNNSIFKDDTLLKSFVLELTESLHYETMVKTGKIKLSPRQIMERKHYPILPYNFSCKNKVINRWYSETTIERMISPADYAELNTRVEKNLTRANEERQKDMDHGHENWWRTHR